jgi:hypothetical protein
MQIVQAARFNNHINTVGDQHGGRRYEEAFEDPAPVHGGDEEGRESD